MKKQLSRNTIAIYVTLALIVVRLIIDTLEFGLESGIRIYPVLLGVLVAGFLGLRNQRLFIASESPKELIDLSFIMDFRAAMRPMALTTLLYCAFLFFFYSYINPTLFVEEVENRKAEYELAFKENNIQPEEAEQVMNNFITFTDFVFDPLNWATLTLFGLVFLSGAYALILTLVARKFPEFTKI